RGLTPEDRIRYQTIYARNEGAVAAPTAGLHFTGNVMEQLQVKGIESTYLTLHVGAGTFKPVKADTMEAHQMHAEQLMVSKQVVAQLLRHLGKPLIPVGTTSM